MVDPALALCAGYLAVQESLRPMLFSYFEWQNCNGTPCWRASLVLFAQLVVLPIAIGAAALQHDSLASWCADAGKNGLRVPARVVAYVFYTFLIMDFVYVYLHWPTVVLRRLMIDHHAVCLLGHLYGASLGARAARPCYLFAICALEFGSGFANIFALLKPTPHVVTSAAAYMVAMSLSNGVASVLTWKWHVAARDAGTHVLKRVLCLGIVALLVYLRQIEVQKLVRPYFGGDGPVYEPS